MHLAVCVKNTSFARVTQNVTSEVHNCHQMASHVCNSVQTYCCFFVLFLLLLVSSNKETWKSEGFLSKSNRRWPRFPHKKWPSTKYVISDLTNEINKCIAPPISNVSQLLTLSIKIQCASDTKFSAKCQYCFGGIKYVHHQWTMDKHLPICDSGE